MSMSVPVSPVLMGCALHLWRLRRSRRLQKQEADKCILCPVVSGVCSLCGINALIFQCWDSFACAEAHSRRRRLFYTQVGVVGMAGMGLAFLTPDSDKRKCGKLPLLKPCLWDIGHPSVSHCCLHPLLCLRNMEQCCHGVTGRRRGASVTWPDGWREANCFWRWAISWKTFTNSSSASWTPLMEVRPTRHTELSCQSNNVENQGRNFGCTIWFMCLVRTWNNQGSWDNRPKEPIIGLSSWNNKTIQNIMRKQKEVKKYGKKWK